MFIFIGILFCKKDQDWVMQKAWCRNCIAKGRARAFEEAEQGTDEIVIVTIWKALDLKRFCEENFWSNWWKCNTLKWSWASWKWVKNFWERNQAIKV